MTWASQERDANRLSRRSDTSASAVGQAEFFSARSSRRKINCRASSSARRRGSRLDHLSVSGAKTTSWLSFHVADFLDGRRREVKPLAEERVSQSVLGAQLRDLRARCRVRHFCWASHF